MSQGFPWRDVKAALVGDGDADEVPCSFRDALMLGLVTEPPAVTAEEFRRAVDRRALEFVRVSRGGTFATAVAMLRGRQVGTLGSIVPTGRAFSTLAHILVTVDGGKIRNIAVESGLVGELTGAGVRIARDPRPPVTRIVLPAAAERADLLAGDVEDTYWARAWRLPRRLARLAVLLMAGISPHVIGLRTGLSIRSVRTYTEQLLSRAGVHSRNELAPAALRDGSSFIATTDS
jgi:DNA-binding CsgD family transcriptional regulator